MTSRNIYWTDAEARRALRLARERGEKVHFPPRPQREPGLINSWPFLVPFGLICAIVLIARAMGYIQ